MSRTLSLRPSVAGDVPLRLVPEDPKQHRVPNAVLLTNTGLSKPAGKPHKRSDVFGTPLLHGMINDPDGRSTKVLVGFNDARATSAACRMLGGRTRGYMTTIYDARLCARMTNSRFLLVTGVEETGGVSSMTGHLFRRESE